MNPGNEERAPLLDDDQVEAPPRGFQAQQSQRSLRSSGARFFFFAVLVAVIVAAVLSNTMFAVWLLRDRPSSVAGITCEALSLGLAQCSRIADAESRNRIEYPTGGGPKNRASNPRFSVLKRVNNTGGEAVLIKNAMIWDGVGGKFKGDVAIAKGLIVGVSSEITELKLRQAAGISAAEPVKVIDVKGLFVTPGLVDMHSHVGAYGIPFLTASEDDNEMFKPANPQLRIQDSISFMDIGIDVVRDGGVTTSLVLPGSGTLIGGEGLPIKMLRPVSNEVEDMTLNRGMGEDDGRKWRYMKMACGENTKAVASEYGQMPTSRMGNGWLFRQRLEQARTTLIAQDDWCVSATAAMNSYGAKSAHSYIDSRFPDPIEEDTIVALLRGDVRLQVHCYETHDLEMMVRNKHEFGFEVVAFHHAVEAYLVAPLLARENISAAIFADFSFYKQEAYSLSTKAGQILHKSGAKVAFKSDHPEQNGQHLIYEAQKAAAYGLDPDIAFAAVTSVPAERLGIAWRVGRLAAGYDADILIWDRNPLELGAHPIKIFIDGFIVKDDEAIPKQSLNNNSIVEDLVVTASAVESSEPISYGSYSVVNASKIFIDDGVVKSGTVVVEKGVVECIGECKTRGAIFDLRGGVIIPGLVGASLTIGMKEITSEPMTNDGNGPVRDAIAGKVRAVDGLRVGNSKVLRSAWAGGILHSISVPSSDGFVAGLSVAFRTNGKHLGRAVTKEVVALHVTMGVRGLSPVTPSVSTQFSTLSELLSSNTSIPFAQASNGSIPLIVTAEDPSDISRLLILKRAHPNLSLVIAGASGAHVVASEIAELDVPVLLLPPRCFPLLWEMRSCIRPGQSPSNAQILANAGVKILISQDHDGVQRNLLWEAGWVLADASADSAFDENIAIGSITWNVADVFGVDRGVGRIVVGERAALLGMSGHSPFGFDKRIQLLADGDEVTIRPEQE